MTRRSPRAAAVAFAAISIAVISIAGGATAGHAQTPLPNEGREILDGLASSFALPWRDLFRKKHDSEWRNLLDGFTGEFMIDGPLTTPDVPGRTAPLRWSDTRLSASVKYTPLGYWFVNASAYHYLNADNQRAWSPDFTYVFGYDDWHPYTLSLVYANYGGNRFSPSHSSLGQRTALAEGGVTLAWKLRAPPRVERAMALSRSSALDLNVNYTWTPRYTTGRGETATWKQKAGVTVKYGIHKWLYVTTTAYYYPHPSQQQPWDPDFTYGFGYFDWHPRTFSLQYNNYAGNRYPWRRGARAGFRDGSISLTWSWSTGV
jgi:hypothetical protein